MPKQAQVPVWIISVTQPPAEKEKTSIDPIPGNVTRICDRVGKLLLRFRRQNLIGIENKNPLVLERKILQPPVFLLRPGSVELKLFHASAVLLCDSRRFIRALRINYENFI